MSNAETLLRQRYYQPGETSWEQVVDRIVSNICQGNHEEVREQLLERRWLPNSPTIVNAGTRINGLLACFIVGPDKDTLEHHVDVLGEIAKVAKAGGGCGFTGTSIRAEGSPVAGSAHGYAYGPNAWAKSVSSYLEMITQSGGFRKMALMYALRSDHSDLDAFIDLKRMSGERENTNFNQSIMATDKFMLAANGQLDRIAFNAWENGEPGLLFYDTINKNTPYSQCGCASIEATNPCAEFLAPKFSSCNLGSINVSHPSFRKNGIYDFNKLERTARTVTRFLDDAGSKNKFPSKRFEDWYGDHRPIGIGIMGYADLLLHYKVSYGSSEALAILRELLRFVQKGAMAESGLLGKERGVPSHNKHIGRRNATVLSIAPTGSIAIIAGCSHSIEPIFMPRYHREDERGEIYVIEHADRNQRYFRSAINIDPAKQLKWEDHLNTQAVAQQCCLNGVSKTINFPNDATVEDVKSAMVRAWELGCKGITVYRDGSREKQVLTDPGCINGTCDI